MKNLNRIFSTSLLFIVFLFASTSVIAQEMGSPKRDISLKIFDKKGRPVKNVVVQSLSTGKAGITDRSGLFVFENLTDDDTLSVMLTENRQINIPVTGMELIIVKAVSSKFYTYSDQSDGDGNSMTVKVSRPLSSDENTILNVPVMLQQKAYGSLVELLRGNVSGLNISSDGAVAPVRGPNSITSGTEPLVVLDGNPLGSLSTANSMVNIYSVKTVERFARRVHFIGTHTQFTACGEFLVVHHGL